jgi:tRNA pseudouridine55 synthase
LSLSPVGVLLLDKPLGLSSNAALQRVRRLAGGVKAGHCGSLDPLASGMLPICLGEATRLAGELLAGRKAYRFGLLLGERSATGDAEGEIVERCAVPALSANAVLEVLERFRGSHSQVPPMYSALKREGTPLYRLARAGVTRPYAAPPYRYRRAAAARGSRASSWNCGCCVRRALMCGCSPRISRVRSAAAAGCIACGATIVEPFAHERMYSLEELEALHARARAVAAAAGRRRLATSAAAAACRREQTQALAHGRVIALPQAAANRWRLYDAQGRFMGLGISSAAGELRVQRLFSAPLAL